MATILEPESPASTNSNIREKAQQSAFWRNSAPRDIAGKQQWQVWTTHLAKGRPSRSFAALLNSKTSPLRWGVADAELEGRLGKAIANFEKCSAKSKDNMSAASRAAAEVVASWQRNNSAAATSVASALETLIVAHLLSWAADTLSETDWWQALDSLLQIASTAEEWPIDCELPPDQSMAQQLLAGELPLTLAYLFPEIKCCHKLTNKACSTVSENITELNNGQGMVRGPLLDWFNLLLASWTRCHALAEQSKKSSLSKDATEQLQWAATQALRLSSQNGEAVLSNSESGPLSADYLAGLLEQVGDRSDVAAALDTYSKKLTKSIRQKPDKHFPETSDNCEWAGVATMRCEWEKGSSAVTIDYSSPDLRIGVASGSNQIFTGTWGWETSVEGRSLEPLGSWDEVCWFSDEDTDYLELCLELSGDVQIDRQILLARDESFLLLADYVLTQSKGEISHSFQLPLNDKVSFAAERETREGLLVGKKPLGRALPLALPEWRTDPRYGELLEVEGYLQLAQKRIGHNLACPLLIDLNASRSKKQCTWRQLTVAQSLEIQPHDVAAGFRAQCGKDQWLVYRSLAKPTNRSVLGQNISCECLVARFLAPSGEVDELLEIEA